MLTGRNRHKTPNLGIDCARAVIRNGKHNVRASIREAVHRKSGEIRIKKLHLHITSKVSGSMVWVIDDRGSSRRVDFLNAADDLSILRLQNIFSFRCLSRSHDHILSDFPSIGRGNIYTVSSGIPSNRSIQQLGDLADGEVVGFAASLIDVCNDRGNILPVGGLVGFSGEDLILTEQGDLPALLYSTRLEAASAVPTVETAMSVATTPAVNE